ncbi:SDR family NAD(P)-dependent oxidoreductase [Pseudothermotoga thermarum]|uniref:Short-chain dehydrogenase/reductase SDR n=1 Tax=Pseudothermotoga thermarum DSM 5069 TaxID=688269 RepID=F7YV40_9THEM|nr:SDR family oxidoreductase [Pseudothermotoga thermarum]AEH50337.1 short-chain dehydrogenase/reductase SDR [Pseudothermotoga thermarum DSM 5069]
MKLSSFKWALVTGASSGIGKEFAIELAKRGINIVAVARNREKLQETINQCNQLGVQTIEYLADLSCPENVKKMVEDLSDLKIDLLVNNAGFGLYGEFIKLELDELEKMIELNIKALTALCHFFAKKMVEKQKGGIINVASIAGHLSVPYFNVYSATKAYVYNLSISLWAELRKYKVHVMCVSPGPTDTMFFERAFKGQNFQKFRKMMKPNEVVVKALKAFEKNKVVYIPGITNKFVANFIAKLLPHKLMAKFLTTS